MNWIKNRTIRIFSKSLTLSEVLETTDKENCFFGDLKSRLKATSIRITEKRIDCFFAQFVEKNSEYLLCFAPDGKFLYMEYECWKDLDVKFNTRNLIKT